MSTTSQKIRTKKKVRCTTARPTQWSAKRTRSRLSQSLAELCNQTGPTPWAEVETTEE